MFFSQLQKLCKERGTTPSTVSRELGYSMGSVGHWKKGATPSGDKVVPFADYFGVTTDYLLKGDDNANGTVNFFGSASDGAIQGVNNGSVIVHNGQQQAISDEAAELLRVYNSLDIKKRIKLLETAFSLEDTQGE